MQVDPTGKSIITTVRAKPPVATNDSSFRPRRERFLHFIGPTVDIEKACHLEKSCDEMVMHMSLWTVVTGTTDFGMLV
jgi:hypothetical protein